MTAQTLSLAEISDALGSDVLAFRSASGALGISIDNGETVIASNGCRAPVGGRWEEDEDGEDLDLSALSPKQSEALEGLVALRAEIREISERCIAEKRSRASRLDDLGSIYAEISSLLRLIARTS